MEEKKKRSNGIKIKRWKGRGEPKWSVEEEEKAGRKIKLKQIEEKNGQKARLRGERNRKRGKLREKRGERGKAKRKWGEERRRGRSTLEWRV